MQTKPHFIAIFKTKTGFRANITRKTKISINMKRTNLGLDSLGVNKFGIHSEILYPPKTDGEKVEFKELPIVFQEEVHSYYNLIFKSVK